MRTSCVSSLSDSTCCPWSLFIPCDLSLCLNGLSEDTHQFCRLRPDGHVGTEHSSFGLICFLVLRNTHGGGALPLHKALKTTERQPSDAEADAWCQKHHSSSPENKILCGLCQHSSRQAGLLAREAAVVLMSILAHHSLSRRVAVSGSQACHPHVLCSQGPPTPKHRSLHR